MCHSKLKIFMKKKVKTAVFDICETDENGK